MLPAYGLIGYPLSHSFSPAYFHRKFQDEGIKATYTAFPLSNINELPALLSERPDIRGLNVTIPHKQVVIPFLDELDETASAIGAVNCIEIRNGRCRGHNTDATGFRQSLFPLLQPNHTHALVLGTGGASLAVLYVLREAGINYTQVSRTQKQHCLTYEELTEEILSNNKLIINTTPLGTYPDIEQCPDIPYQSITSSHLLYDLVYNPEETKFLRLGHEQGATTKNGLEMLRLQAEAAWQIWNS